MTLPPPPVGLVLIAWVLVCKSAAADDLLQSENVKKIPLSCIVTVTVIVLQSMEFIWRTALAQTVI